jgi:hypothetical protein
VTVSAHVGLALQIWAAMTKTAAIVVALNGMSESLPVPATTGCAMTPYWSQVSFLGKPIIAGCAASPACPDSVKDWERPALSSVSESNQPREGQIRAH